MEWRDVWRALFPRRQIRRDVADELSFHIEGRVRELMDRGWGEEEARRHVLDRFGDVERHEQACRDVDAQRVGAERRRETMGAWIRDLRLAGRTLGRSPLFTVTVVVTLAVGIGATTAVFGVLEAVLLRPLPFPDAHRLAVVWQNDRATGTVRENASTADYYDYVERSRTFEGLAMLSRGTAVLQRDDAPALQLETASVTRGLLPVLGREVALGRNFSEGEDRPDGPRAVILSHRLWTDLLGADPAVLGTLLTIDDRPHEIVGVLPEDLRFPSSETDVWLPIRQSPSVATRPNHWVQVVGRLDEGVALAAAQAEMTAIMADLEEEYPGDNVNRGAFVERLTDVGRADVRTTLWLLFAAVVAVLAIACVNVANLLLARGASRTKELAVLSAVGAGVGDVRRRFLAEGLLVGGVAAIGGVTLALLGNRTLFEMAPASLQRLGEPEANLTVLGFALLVSGLVSAGFGLLPWLQAQRLNIQDELKDGRARGSRGVSLGLRRILVAAQLALAVALLLGARLLIETVQNLRGVDPGFQVERTVRLDLALPAGRYPEDMSRYPDWPEIQGFMSSLEERAEAIPGVRSAAVVLNHPLDPGFTNSFQIEGRPYDPTQGEMTTRLVTPGYFETAGLALLNGRTLVDGDRAGSPDVVVLNEAAADRYFPAGDALGSRIAFWGTTFREVVGVVADERVHGLTAEPPPAMYVSMYQAPARGGRLTLMLRTDVPPLTVVQAARDAVHEVDPAVPVFNVATMEETLEEAMGRERFASALLVLFAAVALFLAVLGVHGVLAYLVSQRSHEVGVRLALGATRRDVVAMIMGQGAWMTAAGIVVGLVLFAAASRLLGSLLFGVSATAPGPYLLVGISLAAAAMLGAAVPAIRAASIDPVRSLRSE